MGILTKGEYTVTNLEDGRGISKAESTYQKSTSGTVVPTGTWTTNIPSVGAGEYLWTRTLFTYTDNTTSSMYSVGRMGTNGNNGLGISNNNVHYQASSSGTTAPTGTWTATIPTVAANQYLWTRTTITYTDGSTSVSYSVGKMGADGKDAQLLYLTASSQVQAFDKDDKPKTTQAITISAKLQNASGTATFVAIPYIGNIAQTAITLGGTGNDRTLLPSQWTNTQWTTVAITATLGSLTDTISIIKVKDGDTGAKGSDGIAGKDGVGVSDTNITYAQSTSGTTPPSTGWTAQVPTLVKGQYLWTKTVWTYTDNSTETGYTVSYNAKDGNDGTDGKAGKDGVGIASTKVEYVGSTSGTVKPTTGWSTTIPTVAEGSFLWTRTTWTYTDSTSEVGYSVAKMGEPGAKGNTGDSATSYWVTPSVNTIQISATKVLNPTTITFTGYSKTGTANAGLYAGRFNILTSVDGIVYSSKYSSSANQSAYTYTVPADVKFIKARMYQAGSNSILVDEVTIPIIESAEDLIFSEKNLLLKSNIAYSGTAYGTWWKMTEFMEEGVDYVLKVKGSLGTGKSFIAAFLDGGTINLGRLTDNGDGTHSLKFKGKNGSRTDYNQLYLYFMPNSVTATNSVEWIKLIKGNTMFSQWSPAPEEAKLYTAWSNDPNGANMIRTYPNENLVLGTHFKTADDWDMTWGSWSGKKELTANGLKITSTAETQTGAGKPMSKQLVNGDVVTVTFQFRGNGSIEPYFLMNSGDNLPITNIGSSSTTEWQTYTRGYTFPNRTEGIKNFSILTRGIDKWIEIKKDSVKVEIGNRTIYTPNKQEDPVKAEMAYIGYSPKDSNDPADYVWSENPKAKGTFKRWSNDPNGLVDMTAVYPNENLLEDSISMSGWSTSTLTENAYLDTFNSRKNTRTVAIQTSPITVAQKTITELLKPSTTYTVSFVARGNFVRTYAYPSLNAKATGSQGQMNTNIDTGMDWTLTSDWKEYSYTFTTLATLSGAKYILFRLDNSSIDTNAEIARVKLEEGDKTIYTSNRAENLLLSVPQYIGIGSKDTMNPADFVWSVNPEYTQARTDLGLEDKVDNGSYENDKSDIWEEISNRTTEEEAAAIREMAESIKNSYEAFVSSGGQYQLDLEALEARSALLVQNLGDQLATYNFLKTYIKLGEEGLVIGADGSSMKMLLSKDKLSFTDGGQVVAYFSNQSFYINRGAIVDSLQVGQHKMVKLNSDHTVFQWVKV